MKVTGFAPTIASTNPEAAIELFEALGFELAHVKDADQGGGLEFVTLKDANGFRVNVVDGRELPRDFTIMTINVDDFDEAYDLLMAHGFRKAKGFPDRGATTSSKFGIFVSPTGYIVDLTQHVK